MTKTADSIKYFIVASTYDEGLSDDFFKLVEAESKSAIIKDILAHPNRWRKFLDRSYPNLRGFYYRQFCVAPNGDKTLWELLNEQQLTLEALTDYIELTRVDGDSSAKLDILEVKPEDRVRVA
jgi:hypothetical protein